LILEMGRIPAERNTKYSRIKIKLPFVEERAPSPVHVGTAASGCPAERSSALAGVRNDPGLSIEYAQMTEFA